MVGGPGEKDFPLADLTHEIIGAAMVVHDALGPGLLESVYEECLCRELSLRSIAFRRQVDLPVSFKGVKLAVACRADLIIDDAVVVELKAVEDVLPIHEAQLLTYMRLSGKRAGLLLNFYVPALKDGIVRRIL